jgi:hypothetical protein
MSPLLAEIYGRLAALPVQHSNDMSEFSGFQSTSFSLRRAESRTSCMPLWPVCAVY